MVPETKRLYHFVLLVVAGRLTGQAEREERTWCKRNEGFVLESERVGLLIKGRRGGVWRHEACCMPRRSSILRCNNECKYV